MPCGSCCQLTKWLAGVDLQRIAQDRRARMRRRPQADHLRAELDRSVVLVVRDVVQCDVDRHGAGYSSSFFEQNTAEGGDQALTTGTGCLWGGLEAAFSLAGAVNPWLILRRDVSSPHGEYRAMSFLVELAEGAYPARALDRIKLIENFNLDNALVMMWMAQLAYETAHEEKVGKILELVGHEEARFQEQRPHHGATGA